MVETALDIYTQQMVPRKQKVQLVILDLLSYGQC